VLRRIFGPNREEIIEGWRKLHNKEIHNLFSSNIRKRNSRGMRWMGHVPCLGQMRNAYNILFREPEGKRPLPTHRWEGNVKMDLREIGWGSVDWIHLIQDRAHWQALMKTVINLASHKRQEI
jgi:hypothetical protein